MVSVYGFMVCRVCLEREVGRDVGFGGCDTLVTTYKMFSNT